MAKLVECDRCGATERTSGGSSVPKDWLALPELETEDGDVMIARADLCFSCARGLWDWRAPLPRAKSAD